MGNWSGKKKPKNKLKRKAKAEKRLERKIEEARLSESGDATDSRASGPSDGSAAAQTPAQKNWLERIRGVWNGFSPQARVGTLLGVAAILAVVAYQYIETRPTGPTAASASSVTAPAATTLPPVSWQGLPALSASQGTIIAVPPPLASSQASAVSSGSTPPPPPP
ncbi:MAG TPA: hypothetical protein PL065_25325, partial [Polyangiaceae bacterium]|nr:hypothetical protein [Polyangiaceae bacterium]